MSEPESDVAEAALTAVAPIDKGLRLAIAVTLPLLLFCGVYAALQARFVARDTAALRSEVEALHAQVTKLQRLPGASAARALPSPRPTPRKAKAKANKSDGEGKTKAKKGKSGKRKKAKADAEAPPPREEAEGKPRRKGGKKGKKRGKKKRGKAKAEVE